VAIPENVLSVVAGAAASQPPVSFWHHFSPGEASGQAAVDAHLRHFERWDLDFLKAMNDAGFPRPAPDWIARSAADLSDLPELTGSEPEFEAELEVVRSLRSRLGPGVPMIVTVFNAWATLRRLCEPETGTHGPPKIVAWDARDDTISRMLAEDAEAVANAVALLGRGLARFAARCLEAGADGIFLSVRDDWVDAPPNPAGSYDEIVKPADLAILDAAGEASFNMLHICGKALDFARFAAYPAHVLNWADRYAGPSLSEAKALTDKPLSGGVDNLNTLPNGTPEQVEAEVRDAIRQAGDRAFLLTPGCTYDPSSVPDENLSAMLRAARSVTAG